jgi:hypothetical protein
LNPKKLIAPEMIVPRLIFLLRKIFTVRAREVSTLPVFPVEIELLREFNAIFPVQNRVEIPSKNSQILYLHSSESMVSCIYSSLEG